MLHEAAVFSSDPHWLQRIDQLQQEQITVTAWREIRINRQQALIALERFLAGP